MLTRLTPCTSARKGVRAPGSQRAAAALWTAGTSLRLQFPAPVARAWQREDSAALGGADVGDGPGVAGLCLQVVCVTGVTAVCSFENERRGSISSLLRRSGSFSALFRRRRAGQPPVRGRESVSPRRCVRLGAGRRSGSGVSTRPGLLTGGRQPRPSVTQALAKFRVTATRGRLSTSTGDLCGTSLRGQTPGAPRALPVAGRGKAYGPGPRAQTVMPPSRPRPLLSEWVCRGRAPQVRGTGSRSPLRLCVSNGAPCVPSAGGRVAQPPVFPGQPGLESSRKLHRWFVSAQT